MPEEMLTRRLVALPFQVIETPFDVVIKRGRRSCHIRGGAETARLVTQVLTQASTGPRSAEQLVETFPAPLQVPLLDLVGQLCEQRILVAEEDAGNWTADLEETGPDVFYWHFDTSQGSIAKRLSDHRLGLIGTGRLAHALAKSLRSLGWSALTRIDDPLLRGRDALDVRSAEPDDVPEPLLADIDLLDPERFDCLIAVSETGLSTRLRLWNEFAHLHRKPLFPVYLQDATGFVGPLIRSEETACLECLALRRLTQAPDAALARAMARATIDTLAPSAWLSPLFDMVGALAAMELLKHFGFDAVHWPPPRQIEIDCLSIGITKRPALRLPRCPVCCPVRERPNPHREFDQIDR